MKIKELPPCVYFIGALIARGICFLIYRKVMSDPQKNLTTPNMPYIITSWHNRILFFPLMFSKKHRKITYALISPSRDGSHMANYIKQLGINTIRGSSSKRAAIALSRGIELVRKGFNLGITPDGPRGPRYKCKQGPVIVASATGRKILPISLNYAKYWELNNWCRFRIPKPFSKIEVVVGDPIEIPPNLTKEDIAYWCSAVEKAMLAIDKK